MKIWSILVKWFANYLGQPISAASTTALWCIPAEERELQLPVQNIVHTEITLCGIGFYTVVKCVAEPLLK